jgi:hypothetical protein
MVAMVRCRRRLDWEIGRYQSALLDVMTVPLLDVMTVPLLAVMTVPMYKRRQPFPGSGARLR